MVSLDAVLVVPGRLFLVYRVEFEAGIVALGGLDQRSKSVLNATPVQGSAARATWCLKRTTLGRFAVDTGVPPLGSFHLPPSWVWRLVRCSR